MLNEQKVKYCGDENVQWRLDDYSERVGYFI